MAILDSLSTATTALIASNDAVLAKLASATATITDLQTQLAALQVSSTLSPADAAALQAIIDSVNAESAKNAAV